MSDDRLEVEVRRHAVTDDAWLVSTTGDEKDAVWVPRSECMLQWPDDDSGPRSERVYTLVAPEWLLTEKGLV